LYKNTKNKNYEYILLRENLLLLWSKDLVFPEITLNSVSLYFSIFGLSKGFVSNEDFREKVGIVIFDFRNDFSLACFHIKSTLEMILLGFDEFWKVDSILNFFIETCFESGFLKYCGLLIRCNFSVTFIPTLGELVGLSIKENLKIESILSYTFVLYSCNFDTICFVGLCFFPCDFIKFFDKISSMGGESGSSIF